MKNGNCLVEIILCFLFAVFIAFLVFTPVFKFEQVSCLKTASALGYTSEWSIFTGCIVHTKHGAILLDRLQNIDINNISKQ